MMRDRIGSPRDERSVLRHEAMGEQCHVRAELRHDRQQVAWLTDAAMRVVIMRRVLMRLGRLSMPELHGTWAPTATRTKEAEHPHERQIPQTTHRKLLRFTGAATEAMYRTTRGDL